MEIKSVKRDSKGAQEGRWIGDIPNMPDVRLKVRGLSCFAATSLRRAKERAVPREGRERGVLKLEVEQRISREVLHEAILMDWEGLADNGSEFPYDFDSAGLLIKNPDYDIFAGAVAWAAGVVDTEDKEVEDDQSGNSGKSSKLA